MGLMEVTMRNPLTQVTGAEFLFLFAALITIVAAFCWWRKWSRDSSAELRPLAPPARIDLYEVAYFRAGENELARILIVGLIERKYLKIATLQSKWRKSQDRYIERASDHPATADLNLMRRCSTLFPTLRGAVHSRKAFETLINYQQHGIPDHEQKTPTAGVLHRPHRRPALPVFHAVPRDP